MYYVFRGFILLLGVTLICCESVSKGGVLRKEQDLERLEENVTKRLHNVMSEVVISSASSLYRINNHVVIVDPKNDDKGIHFFDQISFNYLFSIGVKGDGPGEISRYSSIVPVIDESGFWMVDYGKNVMYSFEIDSILSERENYRPKVLFKIDPQKFMIRWDFLDDSTCLGKSALVLGPSNYDEILTKFDFRNMSFIPFGYEFPKLDGRLRRSTFAISREYGLYAMGYLNCDLLTVCTLDGELLFNVFSESYFDEKNKSYYGQIGFYKNKIFVSHGLGEESVFVDQNNVPQSNLPSNILVFDGLGSLNRNIKLDYQYYRFCIDEENSRLITILTDYDSPEDEGLHYTLSYFELDDYD